MIRSRIILLVLLLLLLVHTDLWAAAASDKRRCAQCHVTWIDGFRNPNVKKFVKGDEESLVKDEFLCYSCHDGSVMDSRVRVWTDHRHPVGVKPSKNITITNFTPLDEFGRIYCGTCHTFHGSTTSLFMRVDNKNSELCKLCHAGKVGDKSNGLHPIDKTSIKIGPAITDNFGKLGEQENQIICMSCHNIHGSKSKRLTVLPYGDEPGTTSSELCEACHGNNPSTTGKGAGNDTHPVDLKPVNAAVPARWQNGLKIFKTRSGYIVCRSCHNPHAGTPGTPLLEQVKLPGMSTKLSLCVQCHTEKVSAKTGLENPGFHPVGIPPSDKMDKKAVAKQFELVGGKVVCTTCHTPHNAANRSDTDGSDGKILVMKNKNSVMCTACHTIKNNDSIKDARGKGTHPVNVVPKLVEIPDSLKEKGSRIGTEGQIICNSCHRVHHGAKNSPMLVDDNTDSNLCNQCHARKVERKPRNTPEGIKHPIGKISTKVKIAPEILAAGGKTGKGGALICATCHVPHSGVKDTPLLVLPNDNNSICIKCHVRKQYLKNSDHNLWLTGKKLKNIKGETVEEGGICSPCHFSHRWSRELSGEGDFIKQLCYSCHGKGKIAQAKNPGKFTHPTGVSIKGADGSSTLPLYNDIGELDEQGKVFCTSCHNPHQWIPGGDPREHTENEEGNATTSFLRIQNDSKAKFCYDCHSDKALVLGTDHDLALTSPDTKNVLGDKPKDAGPCSPCHMIHNGQGRRNWARKLSGVGDPGEQLCRSCHAENEPAALKLPGGKTYSHPVGVSILNVGGVTDLPTFTEDGTKVKDGNVSCYSCHDPHKWWGDKDIAGPGKRTEGDMSNSFLRIPNDTSSKLCTNCHRNKEWIIGTEHDMFVSAPEAINVNGKTVADEGPCSACHVPHNSMGRRLWARELSGEGPVAQQYCISCHSDGNPAAKKQLGDHTHPVDVEIANVGGKTDLPTFTPEGKKVEQGKVYCYSCHDPHRWKGGKDEYGEGMMTEGDMTNSFLRIPNDNSSSLCRNCHRDKQYIFKTNHDMAVTAPIEVNILGQLVSEGGVCSACHVPHNAMGSKLWAKELGNGSDVGSKLCKSCHDKGLAGKDKLVGVYSHPLDADIAKVGGKTDLPLYMPDGKVDAKRGTVVCMSCHNPHVWDPKDPAEGSGINDEGDGSNSFLRLDNTKSALCANCHQDKGSVIGTDHDMSITGVDEQNILGQKVASGGICSACHLVHNAGMQTRLWAKQLGSPTHAEASDRMALMCFSCHNEGQVAAAKIPVTLFHPNRIWVSVTGRSQRGFKNDYPVYNREGDKVGIGMITCPTCHNPHTWNVKDPKNVPNAIAEGDATNSFLRNPDPNNSLCTDCHDIDAIFRYKYYHVPRMRVQGRGVR